MLLIKSSQSLRGTSSRPQRRRIATFNMIARCFSARFRVFSKGGNDHRRRCLTCTSGYPSTVQDPPDLNVLTPRHPAHLAPVTILDLICILINIAYQVAKTFSYSRKILLTLSNSANLLTRIQPIHLRSYSIRQYTSLTLALIQTFLNHPIF